MAYLGRFPGAMAKLAGNISKYRAVGAKYKQHLEQNGPAEQTEQEFHNFYWSWYLSESKRTFVDKDLPISRKDFTEYIQTKFDIDRMTYPALFTFGCGGLSLVALPQWVNSPHKLPSTFFSTEEEIRQAGLMRDQEIHIKFAPLCGHHHTRHLEFWASQDPKFNEAFDSIAAGFTSPKDPKAIRKLGQFVGKAGVPVPHLIADTSGWIRGTDFFYANKFLGKPHFGLTTDTLVSRTIDHYRDLYQEDKLIQKEGINTLSDFELYQACNRRLVARWEEDLDRAALEHRLENWWTLTDVKEGEDYIPIRVVLAYQTAHFRDPGHLEESLDSLDEDVWKPSFYWAKDAFQRRIEFESGPLRDQVQKFIKERQERESKLLAQM